MSKKSRKRNKRIIGILAAGLGAAALAKRKRNAAIDTGIASAEADKGSAMLDTPKVVVPSSKMPDNLSTSAGPYKSKPTSSYPYSSRGAEHPDSSTLTSRLNKYKTTPFHPSQGRTKTLQEKLSNSNTRPYKSGGRATYKSGGIAKRGVSPILLKGKR